MFGYVVIGMSLVSMCINLISVSARAFKTGFFLKIHPRFQARLQATYEAGRDDLDMDNNTTTTVGVFRVDSSYSVKSGANRTRTFAVLRTPSRICRRSTTEPGRPSAQHRPSTQSLAASSAVDSDAHTEVDARNTDAYMFAGRGPTSAHAEGALAAASKRGQRGGAVLAEH